jgi:ADP-heptose:LPS heptosyltransferase
MFKEWIRHMPAKKIKELLNGIKGYKLVLTGSSWDKPFNDLVENENVINMCGDTSLDELLGLIKGASAFVGWCGGNTIISQHLNTPTLMLWSNYFEHKSFQTNWVSPEKIDTVYKPMNVEGLDFDQFYKNIGDLLERKATVAS